MPFVILVVAAIVLIVAINNTHGELATALEADVPGYFKWAAAIAAILGLGFVPGLKTPSRWLLALVLVVIFLANYKQVLAGFTSFAQSGGASSGSGVQTPTAAYTQSPTSLPTPTQQQISGGAGQATASGVAAGAAGAAVAALPGGAMALPFLSDPSALVQQFSGFGGN